MRLEKSGKIEGDSSADEEPPRIFYFDHLSDVMRYWSELEFHSLHNVLDEDAQEESEMPPPPKSQSDSTQGVLRNPKNWRHKMNLLQRVLLDKHITEAPEPDYEAVGQSLQLSSSQVALYHVNKQKRKRRKQPSTEEDTQQQEEEQVSPPKPKKSKKQKNKPEEPPVEQPPPPPQPEKTVKAFKWKPSQKKAEEAPKKKLAKKTQEEAQSDARPTRVTWSTQEDLLLLQTFVANKTGQTTNEPENEIEAMEAAEAEPPQYDHNNATPQHLQQWKGVSHRLGKPPAACHRRFLQLMKKQNYYRAVQVALADKQLGAISPLGRHYLPSSIDQLKAEYNVKDLIGSEPTLVSNPVLGDLI